MTEPPAFRGLLTGHDPSPAPFALVHRPHATGADRMEVLTGDVSHPASLAGIPLAAEPEEGENAAHAAAANAGAGGVRHESLVLIPYRQIAERGYPCADDSAPLVCLTVTDRQTVRLADARALLPRTATTLTNGRFTPDDPAYERTVRSVVDDVIGHGEGANFVIRRDFVADITDYSLSSALAFFRRLLENESGAYWTFLVHTGERTLVGASPERHVSLRDGTAVMNPVSGTYRYPAAGPDLTGVLDFLADRKEAEELYMVVDEELKMMARICEAGGRITGPYLREMSRLAHTGYLIEGHTRRDVREILRETLFAPTVTGSPLQSATRVVARYEGCGRGYYSGVAALIGRDARGTRTLDSAILIRTADIDPAGRVRIGVGSTLVRHSDPVLEAAETRAKAAGLISALETGRQRSFAEHPRVRSALTGRNAPLADFWRKDAPPSAAGTGPEHLGLVGHSVLVVDMEDTFTAMIGHQLTALGLRVTVRRHDRQTDFDDHDLIVMGPGPGDPGDATDPRMSRLRSTVSALLARHRPFVAVCLSHQALSLRLGFPVIRRDVPNQGVQREIDLFGSRERVGFYNTYAALAKDDKIEIDGVGVVEAARDPASGEIHALRGPDFASLQFHAESVLTQDGPRILGRAARDALGRWRVPRP